LAGTIQDPLKLADSQIVLCGLQGQIAGREVQFQAGGCLLRLCLQEPESLIGLFLSQVDLSNGWDSA
jgi:hypothetical protein